MKSYVSVPTAILLLTIFSFSSLAVDLPKFCVATITKKANKVKDGERVTIQRYSEFDKDGDFNTIFLKDMELNNDREVVGVKINENELKKGLDKTSKEVLWYFPSSTPFNGEVFRHSDILEKEANVTIVPCLYPVKEITQEIVNLNFPFPINQKQRQKVSKQFEFFEDSKTDKPAGNFVKKIGNVMNSLHRKSNVLAHGSGAQVFEKMKVGNKKLNNLFLVSPDVDDDIFTVSPKVEHSKKAKEHITECSDKLHVIYNPEDRKLKESVRRHNGFHRLGERGVNENKIDNSIDNLYQGDASGKIGFADPWRNHFYVISERMVNYLRNELSPDHGDSKKGKVDNELKSEKEKN